MAKVAAKTKKAPAKKAAKKAPAKKVAKAPKAAPKKASAEAFKDMDRKSLAQKARQLKTELLAIRFNVQAPSLKEYRQKRQELASLLGHLN